MRILLIRLSALGDVITASPVPRVIKQAQPEAEVVWAVEERCADAVTGHPFVDEVVAVPSSGAWRRWLAGGRLGPLAGAVGTLRGRLRARPFDVVIDLQGLAKSALVAAVARSRRKIMPADATERVPGVFHEVAPRRIDERRIASMYVSLLEPLGICPQGPADYRLIMPISDAARARAGQWRAERGLEPFGYATLVPGTTRPQKMWPEEYWPRLAALLWERHGLPAVVIGGPPERELAARLATAASAPVTTAAGETSLKETAALLETAAVTIAVDTGPMHMAVAVGCPTVSLFGSTGPRRFEDGSLYLCLHRHFACWPCHRHPTCRHYECLRAITPADAARAAGQLLAMARRKPAEPAQLPAGGEPCPD